MKKKGDLYAVYFLQQISKEPIQKERSNEFQVDTQK